jgi:hypothetical protein
MQRTLIAVFDKHRNAQSAIEELVSSGFSRQQIRLSEGDPTGATSAINGAPGTGSTTGAGGGSIRNFLGGLFGTDNSEYVQNYTDAVTHGHHVLTLSIADDPEAERAAAIVERYGPVDFDQKAAMAGIDAGNPAQAPVTVRRGVKVFAHPAESPLDSSAETVDADDEYFRRHYDSSDADTGENYDEYAPAYQYGSSMAGDEQYRGQPWKDVEPALRSDWEGRNPGSAWSKFKAAVRHGWERITS